MTKNLNSYDDLPQPSLNLMKKQYILIDPAQPPKTALLVYEYYDNYNTSYIYIYRENELLIFTDCVMALTQKIKPKDQMEYPLEGLHWLVDSIENKFWKPPSEGGLDGVFHVSTEINGEQLRIGRSNNVGMEGITGFRLSNSGRASYIVKSSAQDISIPDAIMKEGDLFAMLKKLSGRVKAGEFDKKENKGLVKD